VVIQISSIVLRVCGVLALILGLLLWNGSALNLIPVHMLLGVLVVLSLWIIGVGQFFSRNGSWIITICALAVGVLVIIVGITQSSLMVGSFHWVIKVLHLLLGMLAVGVGQIGTTRYRKGAAGIAASSKTSA
jgi:hypothetical protein